MDSDSTTSGKIPQEHRCVELTLSGRPCGLPAAAGHDRCYIHGLYHALNNGRCSIDVPLLEDENAILFVYSEVARALAQGAMPAANANGILRCCRGAQRLLEEKARRERLEGKKRARPEEGNAQSAAPAASTERAPHLRPDQALAAVPGNLEDSAEKSGAELSPEVSPQSALANSAPSLQTSDAIGEPNTLQASTSCARDESEEPADPHSELEPEPQPWTVEPDRKVVPPPQFANAREKFDQTLARQEGDLTMALIQRGREIRARGGHGLEGVITDIRETY